MFARLLAGVMLLAAISAPAVAAEPAVRVFFGPKAADDADGLYLNLMRFLDTAEKSLHVAVHEIDMISIADKLADKARNGVDVQIVVEADWWRNEKNTAARQVLEAAQVPVYPDTKKSGLMHDKFFIVDGRRVWTGSTNLTETCLLYNPNSSIWIESQPLAEHFAAEFDDMRKGIFGKRKRIKTSLPTHAIKVGSATVRTYFSPQDDALGGVVEAIDRAKTSVDLMCFVFSSERVGEALRAAHQRGVRVRILLDNMFSSPGSTKRWPYVPFKSLSQAGIRCKYDDEESKLHHKVAIVDQRTTVIGSFNFSVSAATTNDENTLVIDSPAVARQYTAEFERLWTLYTGDPGVPPPPEAGDDNP